MSGPRPPSDEAVERIAQLLGRGASVTAIGEALEISRNAVSGIIFRFRRAGYPRFKPAGTSPVRSRKQRMGALADAWADGAPDLNAAAAAAGITAITARGLWSEICAGLGAQAR